MGADIIQLKHQVTFYSLRSRLIMNILIVFGIEQRVKNELCQLYGMMQTAKNNAIKNLYLR